MKEIDMMLVPMPAVYASFNVIREDESYKLIRFPSIDGDDVLRSFPRTSTSRAERRAILDIKRILEVWVGGSPETDGEIVFLGNVYVFCHGSHNLPHFKDLPEEVQEAYHWLRNKYIELFLQEKRPGVYVSKY